MAETLETRFENPTNAMEERISEMGPWFHNLHLPGGLQTAPHHRLGDFPASNWRRISPFLPEDLSGMSALDVGCNAGFYSFELACRGAEVLAIDSEAHYLEQARWAASELGVQDRIDFVQMDVFDLLHDERQFDIVLFLGVLYHLRYPLLALDMMAQKVRGVLVFQTMVLPGGQRFEPPDDVDYDHRQMLNDDNWPRMAFIEKRLAGDPTNWWVANLSCVEAMLRSSGFCIERKICREFYLCRPTGVTQKLPL
ncbi:MAG TPA: TIGR04290 family methyltransferase [Anaerohalosphaeraceae bacterium]|jgi:tRNA (mo5U34)-methyltransferase|nr:TIGR04290 family methyltransferase [Anaerohalosphaeraceae bacterium]HRT50217.1 TIGR04290 family methyltransferase [Anaerohalosphaeraceae bacterium]HRT86148.1 TIGR04290 family methyltransferase [Anaerohalosphaeraceae bacterium]